MHVHPAFLLGISLLTAHCSSSKEQQYGEAGGENCTATAFITTWLPVRISSSGLTNHIQSSSETVTQYQRTGSLDRSVFVPGGFDNCCASFRGRYCGGRSHGCSCGCGWIWQLMAMVVVETEIRTENGIGNVTGNLTVARFQ